MKEIICRFTPARCAISRTEVPRRETLFQRKSSSATFRICSLLSLIFLVCSFIFSGLFVVFQDCSFVGTKLKQTFELNKRLIDFF